MFRSKPDRFVSNLRSAKQIQPERCILQLRYQSDFLFLSEPPESLKRCLVRFFVLLFSGLLPHRVCSSVLNLGASIVQQCPRVPQQSPDALTFCLCWTRIPAVLRHRAADALYSFRRLRTRAQSAMEPATSVRHRRTMARRPASGFRAAPRRLREISRWVSILEPAAPRFMGCLFGFVHLPPPPGRSSPCSPHQQSLAPLGEHGRARL